MTSKGCPFKCTYCASGLLNSFFRRRNPAAVVDEIEHWRLRGIRNFSFYDDALLVEPKEMILPLLREIIKRNLNCNFHCPNGLHAREITSEMALLMRKAGFVTLRFGFETSNPQRQAHSGGKVTGSELQSAAAILGKAGYERKDIGVYLLCGLPGQGEAEIRESIEFVKECGAKPILAEFSPIPGRLSGIIVSRFQITT